MPWTHKIYVDSSLYYHLPPQNIHKSITKTHKHGPYMAPFQSICDNTQNMLNDYLRYR